MTNDESIWRKIIAERLNDRNKQEFTNYKDLIGYNNRLYDHNVQLRAKYNKLKVENERATFGDVDRTSTKIQAMEKKLMQQQEDLTDLHKRKGENSQLIVEMNIQITQQNKLLIDKEQCINEQNSVNNSLRAEVDMLSISMEELKLINSTVRDEHTALQLAFNALEEKYRKVTEENRALVERLIKYKDKDVERMNEENDTFLSFGSIFFRKRNDKMKQELENAAREIRRSSSPIVNPERSDRTNLEDVRGLNAMGGYFTEELPSTVQMKFDAHDGEVNTVSWSPIDRLVATGGADRKVKLWDVGKGIMQPRGTLVGSNAGINSVDFDSTGSMIIGTSNDFATRVWTVADQRIRYTLTGHSGKVMAAKFLGEPSRVVTGSHDATLKIWDLKSKACIETKFAGSRCNDLVITDGSGSTIISGHFDKKIRFWDTHTHSSVNSIELQGKITSLDISRDCNYVVSCVRDNTIKLLDLRQNQIIGSFCNDNFKVSCDWARVAFSPDGNRIAAGSADGTVFIWNVSGRLETILKDHSAAVTAVSWHPFFSILASVDRVKKCTIWSDA